MTEHDLIRWLHERGISARDTATLLAELEPHLAAVGLPVVRVWHTFALSHPLFEGQGWYLEDGKVQVRDLPLGFFKNTDTAKMGPASFLARGERHFHARASDGPSGYEVVDQLFDKGATDYVIFPIVGVGGLDSQVEAHANTSTGIRSHGLGLVAWAVKVDGGLTAEGFDRLHRIHAAFSLVSLLQLERQRTRTILHTYLGRDSGDRVDKGLIRRGDHTTIPAAIAFTDLRDFSGTAERNPPEDLIDLLNDTFDCQVQAIEAHGGHVLAFLGDGLLAIWPDDDTAEAGACDRALAASVDIETRVQRKNAERRQAGKTLEIRYGIALHWGEVFYGNIGATDRLTFTVIGPAVNRAARLEGLGAALGVKPILSDTFAARTSAKTVRAGAHEAKGVGNLEVWTLAPED